MDPVQLALNAISNIAKAAEQANTNQEDCKLLAELAERTAPFLRQLEHRPTDSDPLLRQSLNLVAEALKQAENAVDICSTSTYFVAWIRAKEHNDMLRRATQTLEFALGQLQLPTIGVAMEMNESLSALVEEMKRSRFDQTAAHAHQTHALQQQLDKAFHMKHLGTEEVRSMIKDTLEKFSSIEQRLQDLKSLKDLMNEARAHKNQQEEFELEQIINVVSESIEQTKTPDRDLDVRAYLSCPITQDIMMDPVVLKDSGVTYERSAIEEWIAMNNRRDPVTQNDIVSGELIPNLVIRAITEEELDTNGAGSSTLLATSSPKDICQAIEPGMYEGCGKKIDEDGQVNYIFAVLILGPHGSIQGYLWSESNEKDIQEKAIISGHWSNDSTSLAFELLGSKIEGNIEYEATGRCSCRAFTIKGKSSSITKNFIIEGQSVPIFPYPSTPGIFTLQHLSPCNVHYQYMAHPGLLECEGEVIAFDNTTYKTKLVLILERDETVRGWANIQDKNIGETMASEVTGVWSDNNILSLMLHFAFSNDTTSVTKEAPASFLAEYRLLGDIITESRDEKLDYVVFSGSCRQMSARKGHSTPFPAITEGRQGRFEYRSIRIPSRHPSYSIRSHLLNRMMPEKRIIDVTEIVGGSLGDFGVWAFSPDVFLTKIQAYGNQIWIREVRLEFSNGKKRKLGWEGNLHVLHDDDDDDVYETSVTFDFAGGERVTLIEFYMYEDEYEDEREDFVVLVVGVTFTTNRQGSISIGNVAGKLHVTENFEGHSVVLHGVVARSVFGGVPAIGFVYSKI